MKRTLLAAALLAWSGLLWGNWFFWISDMGVLGCLETEVDGLEMATRTIESGTTMKCSGYEDHEGTVILNCVGAGETQNLYVFARSKSTCESLSESFQIMLQN